MAGSAHFTVKDLTREQGTRILEIDWTGDASDGSVPSYSSDNVNVSPFGVSLTLTQVLQGFYCVDVETAPGSPAPTSYGCTLKDSLGLDLWDGKVATRSTSQAEHVNVQNNVAMSGAMTFAFSTQNTAASAKGTILVRLLYAGSTQAVAP